jgi:DNA polymerase-4
MKLRDHDFTTRQRSRTLPEPVESDAAVYQVARELLRELRSARRVPARLLGVGLSGLAPAGSRQLGLFTEPLAGESERDRSVSRAVDELKERFGQEVVLPGRLLDGETVRGRGGPRREGGS